MLDSLRRSPMLRTALIAAAWFIAAGQLLYWLPSVLIRADDELDMTIYYRAFQAVLAGHSPYVDAAATTVALPASYFYPPQFAVLLAPLGLLPFVVYARLWYLITCAALWAFAYALAKIAQGRPTIHGVVAWAAAIWIFPGVYYTMSIGQCDIVVAAGIALAVASGLRSPAMALAANIKPYALLPVAIAAWRSRSLSPRALWRSRPLSRALWPAALWLPGLPYLKPWVTIALANVSQGTFLPSNVSLPFAVLRILRASGVWRYQSGALPFGPHLFLSICGLIGPAVALYRLRRLETRRLCVAAVLAVALFAPLCWSNYLVSVYTLLAIVLGDRRLVASAPQTDAV